MGLQDEKTNLVSKSGKVSRLPSGYHENPLYSGRESEIGEIGEIGERGEMADHGREREKGRKGGRGEKGVRGENEGRGEKGGKEIIRELEDERDRTPVSEIVEGNRTDSDDLESAEKQLQSHKFTKRFPDPKQRKNLSQKFLGDSPNNEEAERETRRDNREWVSDNNGDDSSTVSSPPVQYFRDSQGEVLGYKTNVGDLATRHNTVFSPKRQKLFRGGSEQWATLSADSGEGVGGRGQERRREWVHSPHIEMGGSTDSFPEREDFENLEGREEESDEEEVEEGRGEIRGRRVNWANEYNDNAQYGREVEFRKVRTLQRPRERERVERETWGGGRGAGGDGGGVGGGNLYSEETTPEKILRREDEFIPGNQLKVGIIPTWNNKGNGSLNSGLMPGRYVSPEELHFASPYYNSSLSVPRNSLPDPCSCFPFCSRKVPGKEFTDSGSDFTTSIPGPLLPLPPSRSTYNKFSNAQDLGIKQASSATGRESERPGIGSRMWGGGEGEEGESGGGGRGGGGEGRYSERTTQNDESTVDITNSPRSAWLSRLPQGQRNSRQKWGTGDNNNVWGRTQSLSTTTIATYTSEETFRLGDYYTDGTDIEYLARLAKFFPFGSITLFLSLQSLAATSSTVGGQRQVTIASLAIGLIFAIILTFVKKVPLNSMITRRKWPYFFRLWKTSFALYVDGPVIAHAVVSSLAYSALTVFSDASRRVIAPNAEPVTFLLLQHLLLLSTFILTLFIDDHVPSVSTVCFGPLPSQRSTKSLETFTPTSSVTTTISSGLPTNIQSNKSQSMSTSISKLEVQRPTTVSYSYPPKQLVIPVDPPGPNSPSLPSSTTENSTIHDSEPGRKLKRLDIDERLDRGVLLASSRRPRLPTSPRSPASPATRFRPLPSLLQRSFKETSLKDTSLKDTSFNKDTNAKETSLKENPVTGTFSEATSKAITRTTSEEESPESCTDSGPLGKSQASEKPVEQKNTDSELSSEGPLKGRSSGRLPSSVEEENEPGGNGSPEVVDPK